MCQHCAKLTDCVGAVMEALSISVYDAAQGLGFALEMCDARQQATAGLPFSLDLNECNKQPCVNCLLGPVAYHIHNKKNLHSPLSSFVHVCIATSQLCLACHDHYLGTTRSVEGLD